MSGGVAAASRVAASPGAVISSASTAVRAGLPCLAAELNPKGTDNLPQTNAPLARVQAAPAPAWCSS